MLRDGPRQSRRPPPLSLSRGRAPLAFARASATDVLLELHATWPVRRSPAFRSRTSVRWRRGRCVARCPPLVCPRHHLLSGTLQMCSAREGAQLSLHRLGDVGLCAASNARRTCVAALTPRGEDRNVRTRRNAASRVCPPDKAHIARSGTAERPANSRAFAVRARLQRHIGPATCRRQRERAVPPAPLAVLEKKDAARRGVRAGRALLRAAFSVARACAGQRRLRA
jgi:hypothetical protein